MPPTDPFIHAPTSPRRMTLRRYPNLKLALMGFLLILFANGAMALIDGVAKAFIATMTEPELRPDWKEQYEQLQAWQPYITLVWGIGLFSCIPPVFIGMIMIPFAAYRAIRDFIARRRLRHSNIPPDSV